MVLARLLAAVSSLQSSRPRVSRLCWPLAGCCSQPGQTPIWGLLHGTSHNTVASFLKTTKGESPCKMCNRILCILITEMTVHSLCHLLVKSHRFHLCSRRGNYHGCECQGVGTLGSSESVCPWVWFYYLLVQLVLSCRALFQLWGIFFPILFKEIVGRHRQKKPSSRKDWALFLPVASEKKRRKPRILWNLLPASGFLWLFKFQPCMRAILSLQSLMHDHFSSLPCNNNVQTSTASWIVFLHNEILLVHSH